VGNLGDELNSTCGP